jgi:hypothetical protein
MIQVLRDDERLAIFRDGDYRGLKGPGIVLCLPFLGTSIRLRVGDTGHLMSQELAQFGEVTIPVVGDDLSGSLVEIIDFDNSQSPARPRVASVKS